MYYVSSKNNWRMVILRVQWYSSSLIMLYRNVVKFLMLQELEKILLSKDKKILVYVCV